jgi:hypothetical protein
MTEFLNLFTSEFRQPTSGFLADAAKIFLQTIGLFHVALGENAFRPVRALNAAVFDSMTIGLARRITGGSPPTPESVCQAYGDLLKDTKYVETVSRSTADDIFVQERLRKATNKFAEA